MHSSALKHYAESLKQMPTLPPVAIKLIEVAGKENVHLREIISLIEIDQALTSKILFISNSAQFNFSTKISTVEQAVSLLGLSLIRTIALSIIVFRLFHNLQDGKYFNLMAFWHHNVACAIASELLARRFNYPQPQEAFAAGLMHDIGKMVLYQWDASIYDQTVETARKSHIRLLENEEKCFGIGHTDLAYHLMSQWRFPESLTLSAWLHHQPLNQLEKQTNQLLPLIIKSANCLCHIQRLGDSGNSSPDLDIHQIMQLTGFTQKDIQSFSHDVLQRFEGVSACFDFKGSTVELYLSAVARANEELSQLSVDMAIQHRNMAQQCQILEAIRKIAEALPIPVNSSQALVKMLDLFSKSLPHRRLLGFIPRTEDKVLEGYLRLSNNGPWERILFPLQIEMPTDPTHLTPREQIALVEKAIISIGSNLAATAEISSALNDGSLIVIPMTANGCNQGQILIEVTDATWNSREGIDLLRQFGRAAGLAIQRVLIQESSQRQAEDLVRTLRQIDEVQTRLSHMERLSSVGRLAAGAAHEINNPLTVISGRAQLLIASCTNENDRKALQLIIEQSGRIAKIIRDLMGLAKPAEPNYELISLEPILQRVITILSQSLKAEGIVVEEDYQPGLPSVYADAKQLEQVFLNLAINAVQAMPRGGTLRICIGLDEKNHKIKVEISDTGEGIEEKDLRSIFDPFFTTKKEGEGTGLGLTICQSVIQTHRGEITVSSKVGQGTTFCIALPLMSGILHQAMSSGVQHPAATGVGVIQKSQGSILVVDDEADLSTMLVEILTKKGYKAEAAGDGIQGLEMLAEQRYDLMILDLRMPRKPGLEVLEVVRETQPELPVIVLSGVAHENEFKEAMKVGARLCIKKPFEVSELLLAVHKHIVKRQ